MIRKAIAVVFCVRSDDNSNQLDCFTNNPQSLMAIHSPVRPPAIQRRSEMGLDFGEQSPAKRSAPFEVLPVEQPWWQQAVAQMQGNEGAGYAISFVAHLVLLMLLAIPIINSIDPEEGFTTLVENATEEHVVFDAPLDTLVAMPEESTAEETSLVELFDPISTYQETIPQLKVDAPTALKGEGAGTGSDGNFGGGRITEPENAVRAGNFSVWPWPILPGKIGGQIRHGTPGDFPKVRQSYSIVIRVKVPQEKKYVRLSDFTGTVVGTDGYTQKIPEDAYFFRENGELIKAKANTRMPVIGGTAEILVQVPGAGFAEVKDTIRVYSRIVEEEQEIELIFKARE